jgi:hypothetical protein
MKNSLKELIKVLTLISFFLISGLNIGFASCTRTSQSSGGPFPSFILIKSTIQNILKNIRTDSNLIQKNFVQSLEEEEDDEDYPTYV